MIKLALKDLKLFFADKRSMMLTFAMPIALITLFAFVYGGTGGSKKESNEYNLPVCDLDNTASSKDAIAQLDSLKTIHVVSVKLEVAQEDVKKGKKDVVLIFHKGFDESLTNGNSLSIELQYDEAKEMEVGMLQQALYSTLLMLPFTSQANMQVMMNNRFDKMLGNADDKIKNNVHVQFDSLYKTIEKGTVPNNKKSKTPAFSLGSEIKMTKLVEAKDDTSIGLVHAVAGTAIMMLLFSVAGMGAGLLDEKQEGTLKKLLYSPLHPNNILFGKIISTNIISISQLVIMFVFASLAFGLDIANHLPSLILMILATAFACSSFGVLLASFAKSRQQVQGLSTLIILVMSCVGGSMIPTFAMPALMQKFSVFSVNYWGIQGFYDIFWRMLPLTDSTFLSRIIVLLLIGTILNVIALRMFKKNILKIV